jgi:type IV pilus biogenesis protein CpaD/CtpE
MTTSSPRSTEAVMTSRLPGWLVVVLVAALLAPAANADPITVQAEPIAGTPVRW